MIANASDPANLRMERARQLAEDERDADHAGRWLLAQTLLGCVAFSSIGIVLIAWSIYSTDVDLAQVAFWGGLALGDGGMFALLLRHYARKEAIGL